jgi:hypothetical protein
LSRRRLRCWVSSSDTAPAAIALQGVATLVGTDGEREIPVAALYRDDGIDYMAKKPAEVVTGLHQERRPAPERLRQAATPGSIDFRSGRRWPWCSRDMASCRIVLSAVASHSGRHRPVLFDRKTA